jgi:hypothetical protein
MYLVIGLLVQYCSKERTVRERSWLIPRPRIRYCRATSMQYTALSLHCIKIEEYNHFQASLTGRRTQMLAPFIWDCLGRETWSKPTYTQEDYFARVIVWLWWYSSSTFWCFCMLREDIVEWYLKLFVKGRPKSNYHRLHVWCLALFGTSCFDYCLIIPISLCICSQIFTPHSNETQFLLWSASGRLSSHCPVDNHQICKGLSGSSLNNCIPTNVCSISTSPHYQSALELKQ